MDFDDVLKIIGDFGKYQKRFYVLVSFPVLFKGFQVMMVVFTVFVPKHRCAIPGLENDTYEITSEAHRQMVEDYIPYKTENGEIEYDKCSIYIDANYSSVAGNGNASRQLGKCSQWVYDQSEFESTLITKFDLVCDRKEFRAHSNMMMMAGFLAGSLIASVLCDWIGRKLVYCCCLVTLMIFGVISAFPPSSEVLLAYRFLNGLGLMGVMVSGFVLAVEMIGPSRRTMLGAAWQIVWLIGPFIVGALSYIMRDWQQLQLCGTVPPVVFILYWWLVPESPRWQVTKGRVPEAMVTLRKAADVNGVTLPASVEEKLQETSSEGHGQAPKVAASQIFKFPVLVVRTVIICFNWGVISMTYYGLSLNVSNLGGSVRVNFLLSCVVELLGYSCAVFLLDRLGRKKLHTASMLIAGVACLFTILTVTFLDSGLQWITTALAMIGKMGVSSSFAIIFLYSAELYPTVMRNFGVGGGSMFARIGSMVSPYIADLAIYVEGPISKAIPLIVFGALAVAAGLFSLVLPETLHRKLPETLEDAVNFGMETRKEETELDVQLSNTADDSSENPEESKTTGMLDSLIPTQDTMKDKTK